MFVCICVLLCVIFVMFFMHVSVGELEESLKLSPGHFKQTFQVPAPLKDDDNIVFHCKSGNRSVKALGIAYNLGFTR